MDHLDPHTRSETNIEPTPRARQKGPTRSPRMRDGRSHRRHERPAHQVAIGRIRWCPPTPAVATSLYSFALRVGFGRLRARWSRPPDSEPRDGMIGRAVRPKSANVAPQSRRAYRAFRVQYRPQWPIGFLESVDLGRPERRPVVIRAHLTGGGTVSKTIAICIYLYPRTGWGPSQYCCAPPEGA